MVTVSEKEKQTSFYLHSDRNCRLYPSTKYPLTHLVDYQNIEHRLLKQPTYVKHFKYTFLLLLSFILICVTFFRTHIYVYNSFFGPFHLNLNEFINHVKNYEDGQSWFKRIEYIQIELGENNIRNPLDTYDTIRRYSNPRTRENHIATYKKVKKPQIYVKLPTRSQKHFHAQLPFHFSSYSILTLKCIARNLQLNSETIYKTWIEKSEYVKYINEEYTKNSTRFNILVWTKCGILIGYLYRPMYEKAFLPTKEHTFDKNDIALDVTRQYYSFYSLLIGSLIFLWLFFKAAFYLTIYLFNIIRFKFFYKYRILSFPLVLHSDILDELWLLNIDDPPHEQLLQLDEFIRRSEHKFNNQLFIIKNHFEQLLVVLFRVNLYEKSTVENNLSPFIICPVTDIQKIVQYGGICYGENSTWIPWPSTMTEEQNYSEWLHEELMEISEHYKKQYEDRLRYEQDSQPQSPQNFLDSHQYPTTHKNVKVRRQRKTHEIASPDEVELKQFIREEENFQRLKLERQQLFERIFEPTTAASSKFIAKFRMKQKTNQNLIDLTMEGENLKCMICLEYLKLDDPYEKWPCPTDKPHIFHYDCMLNTLRRKNTCPMCRHPVEANQIRDNGISQFFTSLVL